MAWVQFLALVAWVHKMFAWVEKLAWVNNIVNIPTFRFFPLYNKVPYMYSFLKFVFLHSLCSFHYSNWRGPEIICRLNSAQYYFMNKIKRSVFDRFPYLFPGIFKIHSSIYDGAIFGRKLHLRLSTAF